MADMRKWDPMRELSTVQKERDDMFRRVFGLLPTGLFRRELRSEWYPSIDTFMRENQLVVRADIPGVAPRNVDISVTGNVLTVKGERQSDVEEKQEACVFHG